MDTTKKKLPIGIENFEKLRKNGYYYVDKTGLICELLQNLAEVTLFTRPRRFGKSLTMSMLKCFFELDGNKEIFKGLEVMEESGLCEEYMGKFPVISLSLKDIDAESYETAFAMAAMLVNVKKLLADYDLFDKYSAVKEWYDGYRFGEVDVYCPWDVINYCALLCSAPNAQPENYWANSSGNDAVRRFIREAGDRETTKREIESLIAGELVTKEIHQEITYPDMYSSIDNIWSVLFTTGYLTQRGKGEGRSLRLAIPNLEVREIFTTQIMDMFKKDAGQDGKALDALCRALQDGNEKEAQKQLQKYLKKTISIRDTFAKKELKENFYHGILLGLLAFKGNWAVSSNREAGEGYADILVEIDDEVPMGIVIEVKYARDGHLDAACQEALGQIQRRQYGDAFYDEDIEKVLRGVGAEIKRS